MALVYKDRVKETTTTHSGTGTFTLAGAVTGFQAFSVIGDGNTCIYSVEGGGASSEWEVGIGTYTLSGTTLARTTILASSNSGSAVNFTSGAHTVFVTWDAAHSSGRMDTVSVTGTATLTTAALGNLHICSGTSADYTVTLPTAASCSGGVIHFVMAAGLTKLVTLDANGSETIDGALTRIMWTGETATLFSDGSTWTKIAGKTIPIIAQMRRDTAQSIANATVVKIAFDNIVFNSAGMADATTNDRFDIKRPGKYLVECSWYVDGSTSGVAQSRLTIDTAAIKVDVRQNADLSAVTAIDFYNLAVGSYVELYVYQNSGGSINTSTAEVIAPRMTVTEIPSW